jgi:hypothetical protein
MREAFSGIKVTCEPSFESGDIAAAQRRSPASTPQQIGAVPAPA